MADAGGGEGHIATHAKLALTEVADYAAIFRLDHFAECLGRLYDLFSS